MGCCRDYIHDKLDLNNDLLNYVHDVALLIKV